MRPEAFFFRPRPLIWNHRAFSPTLLKLQCKVQIIKNIYSVPRGFATRSAVPTKPCSQATFSTELTE